jgi:hypothetical protein
MIASFGQPDHRQGRAHATLRTPNDYTPALGLSRLRVLAGSPPGPWDLSPIVYALDRAQAEGYDRMVDKYFGEWVPYSGTSAAILGCILLAIAAVLVFLGFKLKEPLGVKAPGRAVAGVMIAVWILSILTFLINVVVYSILMGQAKFTGTVPPNPITKFTLLFALLSFLMIFFINRKRGWKIALLSAALAAMAGPMIFELPFDLIVMSRTYPPIPPDPRVLRALFFFPLFLVELTTISLMFLSPLFQVTKYTLYCLAGMFFVFAVWGFLSFSFAYTTGFLVLNVAAKAIAFATVVTLFLPQRIVPTRSPDPLAGVPAN